MNGLLDDLKDEAYSVALSSGNLLPKPREPMERFSLVGYRASIAVSVCQCGSSHAILVNILALETGTKGSSKATAVHLGTFEPQPGIPRTSSFMQSTTKYCINCLGTIGWENAEEKTDAQDMGLSRRQTPAAASSTHESAMV